MENAYKTLFLGAGATIQPVGTDIQQLDFKVTQGAGETRIAAAAGVPPVIVGFSEGLEAATYSNYEQAMRRFADLTMRPLWRMAAGCFEVDPGVAVRRAELWYDDRDIPALQGRHHDSRRSRRRTRRTPPSCCSTPAGSPTASWTRSTRDDLNRLAHPGLSTRPAAAARRRPAPEPRHRTRRTDAATGRLRAANAGIETELEEESS